MCVCLLMNNKYYTVCIFIKNNIYKTYIILRGDCRGFGPLIQLIDTISINYIECNI